MSASRASGGEREEVGGITRGHDGGHRRCGSTAWPTFGTRTGYPSNSSNAADGEGAAVARALLFERYGYCVFEHSKLARRTGVGGGTYFWRALVFTSPVFDPPPGGGGSCWFSEHERHGPSMRRKPAEQTLSAVPTIRQ